MINKADAIASLHPNTSRVVHLADGLVALDSNGHEIKWDATAVDKKQSELTTAFNLEQLRIERNRLLAETDYLALSDQTLSVEMTTYRQALRDITKTATSLDDVSWPEKP